MRIDPANPVAPTNIVRRFGMDQVPDHVPPELVRQAGIIYSPEFLADPYKFFAGNSHRYSTMSVRSAMHGC